MKKTLAIILGLAFTLLTGFVAIDGEKYDIVEDNGFQVIKDNDSERSTIVVKVTTGDADGDGYVLATNVYDSEDNISIDKEDYKIGDTVLVTFHGDIVEKTVKE